VDLLKDLDKNDILIVIVPKKEVIGKLTELNKLAKKDSKVSIMVLNKYAMEDMNFVKYVHNIVSQVRLSGMKGLFLCAKEDLNEKTMDDLKMFADKFREVGKV